ncbi:methyltransferase domain-containing protein [Pseudomonas poae]|nr:methyltransferase domain-containing protein [Pseudomonas poae]
MNNPLPLANTHDRVTEAYYGKLGEDFMRQTRVRVHWICAQVSGKTVLDIGCSQGILPVLLAREGHVVTGVDNSPKALEEAAHYLRMEPDYVQQKVRYVNADFLSLDTLGAEPDSIVISEVLEHLIHPQAFIEKAASMLKPGGQLIITVPFGVNDYIDHKHTFYLLEPFRLLSTRLQVVQVEMLGKWVGMVAINAGPGAGVLGVEQIRKLESAFESIERSLRGSVAAGLKQLEQANHKYHAATEQVHQLKHDLALSTQHTQALDTRLQRADTRCHLLENRLIKTRASTTYQVGYQLRMAAGSLRAFLRLPATLFNLYQQARARRKGHPPLTAAALPRLPGSAPLLTTPPPRPLADTDHIRDHLLISPHDRAKPCRIACVLDTFSHEALRYESELLQLTPDQALAELHAFQPDLLFIESAWRGKDDQWGNKIAQNSAQLRDVLQWCRQHKVPTVFWNKEDPVHFETFLSTAKQFDQVFTTDIDCIHRYKSALGHERVYLLPFACQPATHNPIELFERKDAFCFAGAYYTRYTERARDLERFVSDLPSVRPLEIFDRNLGKPDANYAFAANYQGYIVGTLDAAQMDLAYKGYRYAINLNSIKQSQSMFARRVFELLGSNTLTVSNFSRGLRVLLGELVICCDSSQEALRRLAAPAEHARLRLAGLRKVMLEHTYAHRLSYVMSKVTGREQDVPLPTICLIADAANEAQLQALTEHLRRQHYPHVTLCVVVNDPTTTLPTDPRLHLIDREQLGTLTLGELANGAQWLGALMAVDYYGPNYLIDLALATRYSKAQVIGKMAHHVADERGVHLKNPGQEYRCASGMAARRALISTSLVAQEPAREWLERLPTLTCPHPQSLAIDAFNYCENAAGSDQQHVIDVVNDLKLNTGLSLDQLQRSSEAIAPLNATTSGPQTSGRILSELFGPLRSKCLQTQVENNTWHIGSCLADGKHEYHYARLDLSVAQLRDNGGALKLLLDATPGLNLQLVVQFLDAQKQRISHVMQPANRNQTWDIPPEAAYLRLGLRAYGSGSTTIRALIQGHRDTQPSTLLTRAEHLLLTNHYPSYDDLYRNGFIHTRITAYREQGLAVDVFRLRPNEPVSYHEFENVDVMTGPGTALANMLDAGRYKSLLVHFLDPQMWEIVRPYLPGIAVIVWVHGAEIQPWWRRAYNYDDEAQLQLAKVDSERRMGFWRSLLNPMPPSLQLVFVSQQFAEEVMEDLGFRLPQGQYRIIHNPINTRLFSFQEKPLEQRKKILSIRPYVSRTYANDLSVKAIQRLATKPWFNELEFLMVGDGPLFEETLAPLRQYPNVKIDQRYLSQAEIADLHKHYGVFLCPSRMDTQGVSRDEAMASGLVPVTSRVAAIPEFVDDACGFLSPPESFSGLSESIETLFFNPQLFRAKSLNARQRVLAQRAMQLITASELSLIRETHGERTSKSLTTQDPVDTQLVRTLGP